MQHEVYNYSDPIDFLSTCYQELTERNPSFSLRAWAHQIGLPHASILSMVLSRKRQMSLSLATKLTDHWMSRNKMEDNEARYFQTLTLMHSAKSTSEKNFYESILATLCPNKNFDVLRLEQQRALSEWYYFAIMEMTLLEDFKADPEWIFNRLGRTIQPSQISGALKLLLKIGMLEKNADGKIVKSKNNYTTTRDKPDTRIRRVHSQLLEKAILSLETQDVHERDITSHFLCVSKTKLSKAKRLIREFRRNLAKYLETPNGEDVYAICIQFFNLTEGNQNNTEKKGDKK